MNPDDLSDTVMSAIDSIGNVDDVVAVIIDGEFVEFTIKITGSYTTEQSPCLDDIFKANDNIK